MSHQYGSHAAVRHAVHDRERSPVRAKRPPVPCQHNQLPAPYVTDGLHRVALYYAAFEGQMRQLRLQGYPGQVAHGRQMLLRVVDDLQQRRLAHHIQGQLAQYQQRTFGFGRSI